MKILYILSLGILLAVLTVSQAPNLFVYAPVKKEVRPPTDEEVVTEIAHVFRKEGRHVIVKAILCFYGESGLRYDAVGINKSGSKDGGIAQINDIHKMSLEDRLDYKKNITKAYEIYLNRGKNFNAWYAPSCR